MIIVVTPVTVTKLASLTLQIAEGTDPENTTRSNLQALALN
ncbi:hypothetical protein Cha6605_3753 [Chamaesiphon minutus PCC 6605]|uniref:Uncharacterized protein n=1 Tax=Chamaesiphon minutus (strain ATCC 27169 / PCC 6605) TaxID=1173020 RepID=K9UKK3_CHAP6|nr:hypothetical protein Cha6605_3753 [Chamaesiphon minutus PCC 6605]